jgi:hypothetical protein
MAAAVEKVHDKIQPEAEQQVWAHAEKEHLRVEANAPMRTT